MLSTHRFRSTAVFTALCLSVLFCLLAATQASAAAPVITSKPILYQSDVPDTDGWAQFDGIDYEFDGDTDFEYDWYLCSATGGSCVRLGDERDSEIELRESWIGKTIRLRVTVYDEANWDYFAISGLSDPVGPIIAAGFGPQHGAILDHGTVQLGVNPQAQLIVDGGVRSAFGDESTRVGLRYAPLNLESISDGSPAEGWGVANPDTGDYGTANQNEGVTNLEDVSFNKTADSATSVVDVLDGAEVPTIRVSHAFAPSASSNLIQATVTITNNTSETIDHTRYRRVVDWDVQPTPFNEFVTIEDGNSEALIDSTDDGFSSSNPLESIDTCSNGHGNVQDSGPGDCGAAFDFDFGALAPGASMDFKLYYGAAADEATALNALETVGAEAYSLGQSDTDLGALGGTPATFVLAFSDIGGDPIFVANENAGNTILDSVPDTHSQDETPQFSFHSTEPDADFQCSLDGGEWVTCSSPLAESDDLPEGWHNFRVRAVTFDESEPAEVTAFDPTPAASNFKIDLSGPATYIDTIGADPEVTASPKFRFGSNSDEPTSELTFVCMVDEGPSVDCTDGLELSDLAEGDHSLSVVATDLAGNSEEPPSTYEWTFTYVDLPVTTITTPGGVLSSKSLDIDFSATGDVDGFYCALDSTEFDRCSSPFEVSELEPGAHVFRVYAVLANGLVEATPKELAFSVPASVLPGPGVVPAPGVLPAPLLKPSGKLSKPSKKGVVKLTAVCNEPTCKLAASVKVGKKKYKLKSRSLTKGTSTVKLTFTKKLKKALKNKKRKKAKLTVVLSSTAGSTSITKKF